MRTRPSILPSVTLGVGLGGFVDGILFHQILQWHHVVSDVGCCPANSVAGLEGDVLADGIFHAVVWLVTLGGTLTAIHSWRRGLVPPWGTHLGGLLIGWGAFNLIDSANHFILGLHHVRDDLGGPIGWDIGFLVFAVALLAVGAATVRTSRRRTGEVKAAEEGRGVHS